MSDFITQAIEEAVATLTLNRPDMHNAFDDVMMGQVTDAVRALGQRDDVRAIVLAATGKSFCAGADINWMSRMVDYSLDENIEDARILHTMLRTIRESPRPIIARVQGPVYGGGVGLVAACDMAVALDSALFSLSEVKLGIVPAIISPFVIEKIGVGQARRYALTAERFDADEARRVGLVSEVVDKENQLDVVVERLTASIVKNGPEALGHCKRILSDVTNVLWDVVEEKTSRCIAEVRVSAEGQEGLKAFLEKRKPSWRPN